MTIDFSLEFEGGTEPSDPVRLQFSGPYVEGGPEQIPSFDLDGAVEGFGAQLPAVGLISTGRNLYLEVQGVPYALGRQTVTEETRALQGGGDAEAGLAVLGIDPREWVEDAEVEEGVEVAGVPTTHVAAGVDVEALVTDLNDAAGLVPDLGEGSAPVLSEEQASLLDEAIGDPHLDLFVGEEDDTIRRLALTLAFDVPEEDRPALGGVGSGTASFSIEFANVNGDQRITPPRDARPLEALASQIAGLGALFGVPEIPGLSAPGAGAEGGGEDRGDGGRPGAGGAPPTAGPGPLGGGGGLGEAFERYGQCLLRADPGDQAALDRCNELLSR